MIGRRKNSLEPFETLQQLKGKSKKTKHGVTQANHLDGKCCHDSLQACSYSFGCSYNNQHLYNFVQDGAMQKSGGCRHTMSGGDVVDKFSYIKDEAFKHQVEETVLALASEAHVFLRKFATKTAAEHKVFCTISKAKVQKNLISHFPVKK